MSILVDSKYLSLISSKLLQFKKKTELLWNFKCPYCGDSQKRESKSRGYVYRKHNDLFFKCHNCVKGTTFSNFLQFLDPILHKEYVFERFRSGDTHPNHNYKKPILVSSEAKNRFQNILDLDAFLSNIGINYSSLLISKNLFDLLMKTNARI